MELHNIVIGIVVLIILSLQFGIFAGTFSKVKSYLGIIKNPDKFKVHKVYISVDEIDTINSEDILSNLEYYTLNPLINNDLFDKPVDEIETDEFHDDIDDDMS